MDGFIDDIITINIDDPRWAERAKNTALLNIHTMFRPRKFNKPLKRDDPLLLHNITGEGQIADRKTFLGWDIHTYSLQVFLTHKK